MKFLQKLGKSMMLPIAVLPICGILMGIGYILCPASMQGGEIVGVLQSIGYILVKAGGAIIDNMSILFVIGVALGMSDDNSGIACLAGISSWLTITVLLSNKVITTMLTGFLNSDITSVAFSKIQNPFIGILCGLTGAICYNKFKTMKMPDAFAFFSGKRFVSIATVLISVVMAIVLVFVWPFVFGALYYLGNVLKDIGAVGAGIYAFLNRLLIPTGLHHALNNVFWFDTIGIGDLTNFWAGKTSADVGYSLGCYMSGFFPCMMFGIPGAALAIFQKAKNKKKAASILLSCSICAFVCGLTEPFEFMFMFLAFPLYIIYAFLYGIFTVITYFSGFRAGFSFSAGAIDLAFSASLPAAAKTWMILILGAGAFFAFYFIFRLYLKIAKKDFFADDDPDTGDISSFTKSDAKANRYTAVAYAMLTSVGGAANVISAECCATRLRLELKDGSLVDKEKAKKGGALGVFLKGQSCQLVIGTTVQQVCDEFKRLMSDPNGLIAFEAQAQITCNSTEESGSEIVAEVKDVPTALPLEEYVPGKKVSHGQKIALGQIVSLGQASTPKQTGAIEQASSPKQAGAIEQASSPVQVASLRQVSSLGCTNSSADPSVEISDNSDIEISFIDFDSKDEGSELPSDEFTYTVKDSAGLHARPAGKIVKVMKDNGASGTITLGEKSASITSVIELMSLGIKQGDTITVSSDNKKALKALKALIEQIL